MNRTLPFIHEILNTETVKLKFRYWYATVYCCITVYCNTTVNCYITVYCYSTVNFFLSSVFEPLVSVAFTL